MKKLLIFSLVAFLFGSCKKDLTSLNEQTKKAAVVPAPTLFANAARTVVDGITSPNVNTNVFRFTVQHWAMTTYQDEVQYDFATRAIPQAWWTRMYRDALIDLKDASNIITADGSLDAATKANQLAMVDIMQVYTYQILVNSFGNIPYSEALNFNNLFPKYDDAKTVYYDLTTRLANDISKLSTTGIGFSATQDLIAGGSVSKWIKFANSLQIKMGMTIADIDDAKAKALFESADTKAIASAADNISFTYLSASPNTNPIWVDYVQSGRQDYVGAKPLVDSLNNNADPRLPFYFMPATGGAYVGGIVGGGNTFASTTRPSSIFQNPALSSLIMDYAELEFYRAEAKERGYTVSGTAESHYNNAITASIIYWGGSAASAATYLAKPSVAYTTAAGTWKQKIGYQKWIALYNRPVDGWTEIRRLDFPVLAAPLGAKSGFPNRLTYPGNEQQLNGTNYTAAAAAIGGDKVETKLFWDKY